MVFSSLIFLNLFLPLFLFVYLLIPQTYTRLKNGVLLFFSLIFYSWGEPTVIWCMVICILVNWGAGIALLKWPPQSASKQPWKARWILFTAIAISIGLLGYFKYATFAADNTRRLFLLMGFQVPAAIADMKMIALPIGISFYTFQALSYTIDVYRGIVPANRNIIDFACYVSMFPQLVAGPIVRYRDVATQLTSRRVTSGNFVSGIRRFMVGLVKKVLIANLVAVPADAIFALPPDQLSTPVAWLGCIAYTLQIYIDFSAYSDMAIGLGQMLGFTFPENFNYPYIAKSIREFWRRWHISLSTWFRDYLYIPLGGSRRSTLRTYFNLWTVFLICGLWHGASWNFILWGAYHGTFLVLERMNLSGKYNIVLPPVLRHCYALLVILAGWVIFRAETIPQALLFLKTMAGGQQYVAPTIVRPLAEFLQPHTSIALLAGIVMATRFPYFVYSRFNRTLRGGIAWESALLFFGMAGILLSVMHLANGAYNPFIYFRF